MREHHPGCRKSSSRRTHDIGIPAKSVCAPPVEKKIRPRLTGPVSGGVLVKVICRAQNPPAGMRGGFCIEVRHGLTSSPSRPVDSSELRAAAAALRSIQFGGGRRTLVWLLEHLQRSVKRVAKVRGSRGGTAQSATGDEFHFHRAIWRRGQGARGQFHLDGSGHDSVGGS